MAQGAKRSTTPADYAEALIDLLDENPWPRVAFLARKGETISLHSFKAQSPEAGRFAKSKNAVEVGTYNKFVSFKALRDDFIYAMGRL